MAGLSPWLAEHGEEGRRGPHLNRAQYLKPVSFIEGDILRVGGFEIGARMGLWGGWLGNRWLYPEADAQ